MDETDLEKVLSLSAAGEIPARPWMSDLTVFQALYNSPGPSVQWFDKPLHKKEKKLF